MCHLLSSRQDAVGINTSLGVKCPPDKSWKIEEYSLQKSINTLVCIRSKKTNDLFHWAIK
jgi:hypothetical protein